MSGKRTVIRRVDNNQAEVVKRLKLHGVSVLHLHIVGNGCPDLLIGFRGANYLVELKNPDNPPSKRELTDDEKKFFCLWKGQVVKAETVEQILEAIGYE